MMRIGLILSIVPCGRSERELDFALALWRHGKRSPMIFQSEFNDTLQMWPDGAGQLTEPGVEIHQSKIHISVRKK